MLVAPEVAALLSAPVLGGAARRLCSALQTPDVHGASLRDTLAAFVRDARAQALPLSELRHALTLMVRDCARVSANDRAGVAEYVLRRATVLYEEGDFAGSSGGALAVSREPGVGR
jgi:hypothetical protein